MKNVFYWFFLLNKRLYKKPVFLVILIMIPLLVFSFGIAAGGEHGFIRIVLAETDTSDPLSGKITDDLMERSDIILFLRAESPEDAVEMVEDGRADAAWIFPADTAGRIEAFSTSRSGSDYVVDVFQREQTIPLRLSNEILCSSVFRHCSRSMYINFVRERVPYLSSVSDDELYSYYDAFNSGGDIFDFSDAGDNPDSGKTNYLLTPLRGLLSIVIFLCALAATLFFIQDKKSGTFSLIPQDRLPFVGFICQLIATLNVGIVVLISLVISGLSVSLPREILILLIYCISVSAFASLVHMALKDLRLLGAAIPLLIVLTIGVCPVFFDFDSLYVLQLFLPPTHYINAAYNNTALIYMLLYCTILSVAAFALPCIKYFQRRISK